MVTCISYINNIMNNSRLVVFFLISFFIFYSVTIVNANNNNNNTCSFGYKGNDGPEHWADLCGGKWKTCGEGQKQSPINLNADDATAPSGADADTLKQGINLSYPDSEAELIWTGHTVEVLLDLPSVLFTNPVDNKDYSLLQFHFHTPSEHQINGDQLDMETHFVTINDQDELSVIAILYQEDSGASNNPLLQQLIDIGLPTNKSDEKHVTKDQYNFSSLFNATQSGPFFSYSGSLTTPPCSENVSWFVYNNPVMAPKSQLDAFRRVMSPNARPVQSINNRDIVMAQPSSAYALRISPYYNVMSMLFVIMMIVLVI
eukprot:gb/GECH01003415.1/.p1 GENE.gb/GECH01003415.1/~~gb/GECH01003415.1/.p1  ORF type:complete len:316 (+),score=19.81 gb/GECH01003415.1/:1-948(+)